MEDKIHELMERFWKDVQSLPWKDETWVNNQALREQTKQHFVNATTADVLKIIEEEE